MTHPSLLVPLALLATLMLSSCADHAYDAPGSEALVYAETHSFAIDVDAQPANGLSQKLVALSHQFDADASDFTLAHQPGWQGQAKRLRQALIDGGLNPQRVQVRSDAHLPTPLQLTVQLWRTAVEPCRPHRLDQPYPRLGCATNANRITQTMNPANLSQGEH
ncbi:hypothetical protein [Ferrimonas sp. SCSIO 43195]|uniref:hypothetical protein n=1 Tax=Ferrimonas sp. SCSIO 43195 TaxID=2822844 RepID=UPI002075E1CC|nr:hypothetical protein [Ferrimonas sp. SCSIO 43195]USD38808.1 hypothetical protein J8Z22_06815 [Ferrimonas sp. SCSIO 43195]